MKKLLLCFAAFVLSFLVEINVSAQNYQPFRKGLTYHYIAQDSIYSMRIDSAKIVNGDSVFVFNPIAKKNKGTLNFPGCQPFLFPPEYDVQNNNQFGKQMLKLPNHDYVFQTIPGQEFLLKTKVATNQTWNFSASPNITATLVEKRVKPVMNTTDSVLIYSLSNGDSIVLSKHYGFLKAPNFVSYADPDFKLRELNFYALPEKGLGHAISNDFAIYDFQPGDQFLYYGTSIHSTSGACTETWTYEKVLSRNMSPNGDTVYYTIQEQHVNGPCNATTGRTLSQMRVYPKYIYKNYVPVVSTLTNGFVPEFGYQGRVQKAITTNNKYNFREQIIAEALGYDDCSKTFELLIHCGCNYKYGVGLGEVYSTGMGPNYTFEERELVAFTKGSETYGTMLTPANIMGTEEELQKKPLLQAFPNPFTNELTVTFGETSGHMQLTLRNTLGQMVWQQETRTAANAELKMQLPELPKGMYVLQVSQNGKIFTTRLVKQ